MSMTSNLADKSKSVTFVVAYGPTYTMSNTLKQKDGFWSDLESAGNRVLSSGYLFVLINANARNSVGIRDKDLQVIGAYGADTRVSDCKETSVLRFVGDNKLVLVNMLFSIPKGYPSRTFNGPRINSKRLDYIITGVWTESGAGGHMFY